jgi:ATP-dependent protease ClpP protease subunit
LIEEFEELSDIVNIATQASPDFFLERRVCFLDGEITERSAAELKRQILYLGTRGHGQITLVISSFGGESYEAAGIIDLMETQPKTPITTIANGKCMSAAAYILIAGYHRIATPHTRIMLHEASSEFPKGNLHAQCIEVGELAAMQRIFNDLLHRRTKLSGSPGFLREDQYFSPKQALKYGLIDEIGGVKL